jgi:hypothetical protein
MLRALILHHARRVTKSGTPQAWSGAPVPSVSDAPCMPRQLRQRSDPFRAALTWRMIVAGVNIGSARPSVVGHQRALGLPRRYSPLPSVRGCRRERNEERPRREYRAGARGARASVGSGVWRRDGRDCEHQYAPSPVHLVTSVRRDRPSVAVDVSRRLAPSTVETKDGVVHRVTTANHMGQAEGKITLVVPGGPGQDTEGPRCSP